MFKRGHRLFNIIIFNMICISDLVNRSEFFQIFYILLMSCIDTSSNTQIYLICLHSWRRSESIYDHDVQVQFLPVMISDFFLFLNLVKIERLFKHSWIIIWFKKYRKRHHKHMFFRIGKTNTWTWVTQVVVKISSWFFCYMTLLKWAYRGSDPITWRTIIIISFFFRKIWHSFWAALLSLFEWWMCGLFSQLLHRTDAYVVIKILRVLRWYFETEIGIYDHWMWRFRIKDEYFLYLLQHPCKYDNWKDTCHMIQIDFQDWYFSIDIFPFSKYRENSKVEFFSK